jgi:hypothetical protein
MRTVVITVEDSIFDYSILTTSNPMSVYVGRLLA